MSCLDRRSIVKKTLKGHKSSVEVLEFDPLDENVFASAAENVRLWDLRTHRPFKCFHGFLEKDESNELASIVSVAFQQSHWLHIASSTTLYTFDTRKDGILDSIHVNRDKFSLIFKDEEIFIEDMKYASETNALALSLSNGRIYLVEDMVADKDDYGYEELMCLSSMEDELTTDSFLAPNLAFGPAHEVNNKLYSGGFDCTVRQWSLDSGGVLERNVDFTKSISSGDSAGPMVNPPFIYGLETLMNGEILLVAAGNGNLYLVDTSEMEVIDCIQDATSYITSALCVADTRGQVFMTGGNDGIIRNWLCEGTLPIVVKKCWELNHEHKINDIAVFKKEGIFQKQPFVVSDTSTDVTLYFVR